MSYYFTDGETTDYNDKKTYVNIICNEKGIPVKNARFSSVDFLIMAGKSDEVLSALREELRVYPKNWLAHMVYNKKYLESAETLSEYEKFYDDILANYDKLVAKFGEADSIKQIKASMMCEYKFALYPLMYDLTEKTESDFLSIMKSIPEKDHHGFTKSYYRVIKDRLTKNKKDTEMRKRLKGAEAPDFEFTTINNVKGKLSGFYGKYVLLDFWATWCGPCVGEIPKIKKAYNEYHEKGFEIISISCDDIEKEKFKEFIKSKKMTWTHVLEGSEGAIQRLYNVSFYPTFFLIDKTGKVIHLSSEIRGIQLKQKLRELLDNQALITNTNAYMLRIIQGAKFVKKPANNMLPIIRPRFKIHKLIESEKEKLSVSSRIVLPRLQRKTL